MARPTTVNGQSCLNRWADGCPSFLSVTRLAASSEANRGIKGDAAHRFQGSGAVSLVMPRRPRICPAGMCFHVLNRAVARLTLFEKDEDYDASVGRLRESAAVRRGIDRTPKLSQEGDSVREWSIRDPVCSTTPTRPHTSATRKTPRRMSRIPF